MTVTRREVYEAGRADERSEIVAFLRALAGEGDPPVDDKRACALTEAAAAIADGKHAEAVVLGAEVPG